MTSHPKIVRPETKVAEIDQLMQQYKIHSVLVLDEAGKLLGIVDSFSTMI